MENCPPANENRALLKAHGDLDPPAHRMYLRECLVCVAEYRDGHAQKRAIAPEGQQSKCGCGGDGDIKVEVRSKRRRPSAVTSIIIRAMSNRTLAKTHHLHHEINESFDYVNHEYRIPSRNDDLGADPPPSMKSVDTIMYAPTRAAHDDGWVGATGPRAQRRNSPHSLMGNALSVRKDDDKS